jgi:hypothetical protein
MKMLKVFIGVGCVIAVVAGVGVGTSPSEGQASRELERARAALGDVGKIRSIALTGASRNRLVRRSTGELSDKYLTSREEIKALFPDHYLLISDGDREGFAGATIIGTGRLGWRNPEIFGYMMLALLLKTDTLFPFDVVGREGNSVKLRDPNGVHVSVDLDAVTHRPVRLTFAMPKRSMDGKPTGGTDNTVIEIGDYKPVAQFRIPHKLSTFRDGNLMSEQLFETIELNPKLNPASFK